MILDRDLPEEESKLGIGENPVDVDKASQFTLEAELVRLSGLLKHKARSRADERAVISQVRALMKQAVEDKGRLSQRGLAAFNNLMSIETKWNEKENLG